MEYTKYTPTITYPNIPITIILYTSPYTPIYIPITI